MAVKEQNQTRRGYSEILGQCPRTGVLVRITISISTWGKFKIVFTLARVKSAIVDLIKLRDRMLAMEKVTPSW